MGFQSFLRKSASQVEKNINKILKDYEEELEGFNPKVSHLFDKFSEANQGGKRLRGALVRLGYLLASGKDLSKVNEVAASYEIFQTAILVHDDIIDESSLRRGKPTLYKELGGDHYGISQTICLGDLGFFLALKILSESDFSEGVRAKALNSFSKTMLKTAAGEMIDIELPYLKDPKSEEEVITIFKLKTAQYTITGPLELGAILGEGEEELIKNIQEFGINLGIAFQIQDDILGVFGEEESLGKSVTSDIEEGKITLLYTYVLKEGDKKDRDYLDKYYGQGKIGKRELGEIKRIFKESGALYYSEELALKYVDKAKGVIPKLTKDKKLVSLLEEMANFLVLRNK